MQTKTLPEPLLLTAQECAALLGIGLATFWRRDAAGQCPAAIRHGKTTRWRRADILAWIELGCPSRASFEARRAT